MLAFTWVEKHPDSLTELIGQTVTDLGSKQRDPSF